MFNKIETTAALYKNKIEGTPEIGLILRIWTWSFGR